MGRPYFAPFLEAEKRILQEVEDELRKSQPTNRVAQMSLNRGMPSISQMDGLTKIVEKFEKSQDRMEKIWERSMNFLSL